MIDRRSAFVDRRSWDDRRRVYSLDYFLGGGVERRKGGDRRMKSERRSRWLQVGHWCSVFPWGPKARTSGKHPS